MTNPILHVFLQPFPLGTKHCEHLKIPNSWSSQASPAERVPVPFGQVGFHVKEDILPLLDLAADLLNDSKLLRTRSGLAPARIQKQDIPVRVFTSFLSEGK